MIRRYFKVILIIFCGLLSSFFLYGCGQESSGTVTALPAESDQLVLAAPRHLAPGNKDGFYCSSILQVWEPLITNDDQGNPKAALAVSWQMADNGRRWLFHLRQGVLFHDGTVFNADAVLANFARMKKGLKRSNYYLLDINSYYPGLQKINKIDDYTLELVFDRPNIQQLFNMMNFGSAIYGPACFAEDGNFQDKAIGTGPFVIKENVLSKYVVLERNENYYGPKAKMKQITVKNMPTPEVRYSALKAGEIQGVVDINALPPFLAAELSKDKNFAITDNKSSIIKLLSVNGTKYPFNDVRMRQAVSLAIDREALNKTLYAGYLSPTVNILNYTSPFYQEIPVQYDPERAKALVAEVTKGKRLAVRYCINGADPLQKGEAELIAYWLGNIGIDVTIQSLEGTTLTTVPRRGDYEIARSQRGLANGDPYNLFYVFMMPEGTSNVNNSLGYYNTEVIDLMNKLTNMSDWHERQKAYMRIQEIAAEELPVIPLFNDRNIVAYRSDLRGYRAEFYGITLSEIERENP